MKDLLSIEPGEAAWLQEMFTGEIIVLKEESPNEVQEKG